jgi:hypothetical protein
MVVRQRRSTTRMRREYVSRWRGRKTRINNERNLVRIIYIYISICSWSVRLQFELFWNSARLIPIPNSSGTSLPPCPRRGKPGQLHIYSYSLQFPIRSRFGQGLSQTLGI